MSYQVIARKYRPQRFSDVVGQDHVTQTLSNAIRQNRIAHAYLFVGPRGTGKTTLARIFAKCLNCTGGPGIEFSDDDPRCREIAEGRSLDVLEIDGASNRGIEEIRELRETVKYAPASSRFKIYIIDEVHMLTKEAFNALLKTLEEPPEHVKFMFATTEPEKVLPTILSRCQRFDLRRIPAALIVKHLAHIASLENVQIDEPALYAIARGAEGGMRDAESTLDQLISFCGSQIVESDVLSMFGLAARAQLLDLSNAIIDGDGAAALRQLDQMARAGKDLGRLLSDLLAHFRNLLLFEVSKGATDLLDVSEQELSTLSEQARRIDPDALSRAMDVLTHCESRLRDTASKRILIEVCLLKAIQAIRSLSIETVLARLKELREKQPSAPDPVPAPANPPAAAPAEMRVSQEAPAPAPASAKSSIPAASSSVISSGQLEDLWAQILDGIGRVSAFTKTYFIEAHPVSLTNNLFTIGFDPAFADHIGLVDNNKNRTLIQTKLEELGYRGVFVRFIQAEAPPGRARPVSPALPAPEVESAGTRDAQPKAAPENAAAPPPSKTEPIMLDKDEFKNDPLIKQALDLFKATIVDVRTAT